jgi:hypothetical protein
MSEDIISELAKFFIQKKNYFKKLRIEDCAGFVKK